MMIGFNIENELHEDNEESKHHPDIRLKESRVAPYKQEDNKEDEQHSK